MCGKRGIDRLLAHGKHGNVGALRYRYLSDNGEEKSRILVSVPKKLFKRAVKRNLLKRRLRESYRMQKHDLTSQTGIDLLITYSTKDILSYEEIYNAVGQVIAKINKAVEKKTASDEENIQ